MPKLNMKVSHRLSQDEALERIKGLLGQVKQQFADKVSDLRESWNGSNGEFSFKAMGLAVSGTLVVRGAEVELNGNLPLAAYPFKGKIESTIRERATALLV
jgi:hypothetical protein